MAVGVAAGATSADAQPRMTFKCHDQAAPACDARFVMNGTETFLLGVYDSGFSPPPASWESALFTGSGDSRYYRGLAGIPINAYLNYYQGMDSLQQVQTLLDVLDGHGVMWFQTANCSGDGSYQRYDPDFTVDRDSDGSTFAKPLAGHPAMAGYYVMDECGDASYGTNLVPETQKHHARLKSFDPAAVNFAVPVARGYRDPLYWVSPPHGDPLVTTAPTADLFGTDPYPMYGKEPRTGYPHFEVADYIARLRDDVTRDKPVVAVLQFFKFGSAGRLPTKAEMRMHAYAAIVEGAQGLFWWDIGENGVRNATMKTNQISTAMQNLKDLVDEVNDLKPALLATPTPAVLSSVTPNFATPRGWRIAALQSVIPLISNYADKQWYQAELYALTATVPDYSLSPMLHQASPQSSYLRTRVTVLNGVGYIIAYNYGNTAIKGATFAWQSNLTSVKAFREGTDPVAGRTIAPNGATFRDDFAPYEAHVYIVR
jgi:hypothetical protein